MNLFDETDACRILEDNQDLISATGTIRILLRQPMAPDNKMKANFNLDEDYKTPDVSVAKLPFRERIIEAKIRSLNDYETSATGVGELQIGDLMAEVDPRYYEDPVQPISSLDEIRFKQQTFIRGIGSISADWDFMVHGVHPSWAGDVCIKLKLVLKRKKIATAGGGSAPTV